MIRQKTNLPAIVLDTSVWVKAAFSPNGDAADVLHVVALRYKPVHTTDTLNELSRVMEYPRLARLTTPDQRQSYLRNVERLSDVYQDSGGVTACRDPDDNMFLALALASGASRIVTADRHLLELSDFEGVKIQTPLRFLHGERQLPVSLMRDNLPYGTTRPYPWGLSGGLVQS